MKKCIFMLYALANVVAVNAEETTIIEQESFTYDQFKENLGANLSSLWHLLIEFFNTELGQTIFLWACIIGIPIVYFMPSIHLLSNGRNFHKRKIFLINLLLGWTIIGWFVAYIMAHRVESVYTSTMIDKENFKKQKEKIDDLEKQLKEATQWESIFMKK